MKWAFWVAVASGPVAFGLWCLAGFFPALVESLYSRGLYPFATMPLSRIVSQIPFAIAPVLIVVAILGAIGAFFVHPKAWIGVLSGVSVVVAWFILGWGLNYQRQSWAVNAGWTERGGTLTELERLARTMLVRTNELRSLAWKDGEPPWTELLSEEIPRVYDRASLNWPLLAGSFPGPKKAPGGETLSWLGIAGIYIPFTGEPLVNQGPGSWSLPFTAAHESAHLRGWAREDEANFLAFLVLHDCGDPRLEYSGWSMALLYVAEALGNLGPEGQSSWKKLSSTLSPAVLSDWKAYFSYWSRFKGPVQQAAQAVNDVYLKTQGQTDGVKSYGRMVDLLLACETRF